MQNLTDKNLFRTQAYINGDWVDADGSETFDVMNPATGDLLAQVADVGADETQKAIDAAAAAFPAWRDRPALERSDILRKWAQLQRDHIDDLAKVLTQEQGKPLAQAKGEILSGIGYVEWMAEECRRAYGDLTPAPNETHRFVTLKQPIGVCAMITPWNFPSSMITRKCGPALAAGCTVVLKPAALTPLSALALAELAHRAGVPKGVMNIVVGKKSSEIGGVLTSSDIVKKLSFTGSTAIGKKLIAQCAETVKNVSMELGGNAPFIVFDDADLEAAVPAAIISKYRNSGQTCICANRIFVQDGIYDAFVKKFTAAVEAMKIGNGLEDGIDLGPMINMAGVEKVEEHLADATAKGGSVTTGGSRHELGQSFYQPTVIRDATPEMQCFNEETFGPLAPLFRFKTDEEVIEMANDTEYGLAAYFFSRDLSRVWRVAEALDYGMVGANTVSVVAPQVPFGGRKQSGIGCEGSRFGLDEYLEKKLVSFGGI